MSISICCSTSKIFIKKLKKNLIISHMYVQPMMRMFYVYEFG